VSIIQTWFIYTNISEYLVLIFMPSFKYHLQS
jgi:hypothetical protein